jgi:hypothetical protein
MPWVGNIDSIMRHEAGDEARIDGDQKSTFMKEAATWQGTLFREWTMIIEL